MNVKRMMAVSALALAGCTLFEAGPRPVRIDVAAGESLKAAQERVRALPVEERARGVEVVLADGDYFLPEGLEFTPADGGATNAPVVWRAAMPGKARLLGAERVPAAAFAKVSDPAILARLPEEARGRVYEADLSKSHPGKIPQMAKSFGGTPAPPMIFIGGEFGTLAKWPNGDEWTSFTKRVDKGQQVSKRAYPGNFKNGAFVYSNPRAKRWDFKKGVWLNGYWTHDWANHSIKASSYGAESGTNDVIRLDGEMPYGVMGGTWGRKDRRFRAFNLLEELDAPGEWYLDRDRKILYIIPLGREMSDAEDVRIAYSANVLVRGKGVKNIRFEGIDFAYNYGPLASFSAAAGVQFVGCRFLSTARAGVGLNGERNLLKDCEIYNCGANGVSLSGGDRAKLVKAETLVEGCRIHRFGVFQRTYAPGVAVQGCGMVLRGNEIWDAPHSAVIYGGNEHLFEFNDVHHVLMETGDAGAFYTGRDWTTMGTILRHNFVHELGALDKHANTMGFYFDDCDCGDAVYGNVFWKVARGIMIGGGREHPVKNNIFADCQIGLSIDNRGMTWKCWNTPHNGWNFEEKANKLKYKEEPWRSRYPLLAKIFEDSPKEPLYNPVEDNVFLNCREKLLALSGASMDPVIPKMKFGGNVVFCVPPLEKGADPDKRIESAFDMRPAGEDPGFVDAANGDFRLRPDSRVGELVPALKTLPLGRTCRKE